MPLSSGPPSGPSSSGNRSPFEHLFAGLVCLVAGIVNEASAHPVTPWSYMPGQLLMMVGLGIGTAVWEHHQRRPGTIAFFVILGAIGIWWISNFPSISYLGLALYIGLHQLTRWVLKMALTDY